ncbi:polysaccharide deacetylase family protein ['Paenibacillus yunnanensis' Narsing Rao et al. 2020]|uniref:polysaccharide deacetylase family protein n=1 Tax=Paenibacillus tengchongensis TaxID=2608684 RepID=UPI00124E1092|nr:polysaccharide deacetylase family protein [Paenibacillus tengchongensis]
MKRRQIGRATLILALALLMVSDPVSAGRSAVLAAGQPVAEIGGSSRELNRQSGDALPAAARRQRRSKGLSLGQLKRKYPDTLMVQGPRLRIVALTFDDVPDPRFTPQLLEVLRRNHVKATFFVVGSRAEKHPRIIAQMVRDGHSIGNHSYNHPEFGRLSMPEFQSQIIRTENILRAQTGFKPRLIRPPYGDISEPQVRWARDRGYKIVNWNVDSLDWKSLPKTQVRNNILAHAGKGAVILQHGGGGQSSNLQGTIQALPEVIRILRKRGYTFVTVPQMLEYGGAQKSK